MVVYRREYPPTVPTYAANDQRSSGVSRTIAGPILKNSKAGSKVSKVWAKKRMRRDEVACELAEFSVTRTTTGARCPKK